MTKIILAPDSMKGSASAKEIASALAEGILQTCPEAECVALPIADGGEGTLDALTAPEERKKLSVPGTNGQTVEAEYGIRGDLAVIEMARAAGLTLTPEGERDVLRASTFGVGCLIADALDGGCREILLTVGGSGTNDGGLGMFCALGGKVLDADGNLLPPVPTSLSRAASLDLDRLHPALAACSFRIATDVTNPLLGSLGATAVYGPQKGVTEDLFPSLEAGMRNWAELLERVSGKTVADIPGCGAGGGIAAPLLAFCRAEISSGICAVLDFIGFEKQTEGAALCITGEGRLDAQSAYGKAVGGVVEVCRRQGVPTEAVVGCLGDGWERMLDRGLRRVRVLTDRVPARIPDAERKDYAISHAAELLREIGAEIGRELP